MCALCFAVAHREIIRETSSLIEFAVARVISFRYIFSQSVRWRMVVRGMCLLILRRHISVIVRA